MGRLRRTLRGAKVHDGLVIVGGFSRGQQLLCHCRENLLALCGVNGCVDAEVAGQYAVDVAIDYCYGQSESKAPDGGGCVVAYAFQGADAVKRGGETTTHGDLAGGGMQVAGPAVVA